MDTTIMFGTNTLFHKYQLYKNNLPQFRYESLEQA